ncbi:metal-dependent hydrolase [Rheinheimera sediminis]|uniref:metal-dependent hydrolase n=1 Tax=Rheinheimera sp. YQF-1 TaxID=2499626 RepID=UPI000FDA6A65|nr:metal-dependent hydrolase [Rheinheimera sp. YQF-1]RVT47290.1 metal-dependent hydrolase [Rheinheimera sp. YQF-1]
MDSLSQIALGAAVSVAVFNKPIRNKQIKLWQAAAAGAVFGTLPDLDVLISHGDPISDMTMHRTESHSLFYLSLVSPLFAWLLVKLLGCPLLLKQAVLAVLLVLLTHALLDTMTIYGTQLALPFSDYPFGVGSIFIIDPLYTLPLLLGLLIAFWSSPFWNTLGLAVSTSYLLFGLVAQQLAYAEVEQQLADSGQHVDRLLVTATPFNTLLWRAVVVNEDQYLEGYYSLLDGSTQMQWRSFPRDAALIAQWKQNPAVARLAWFSHGFYQLEQKDEQLLLTDLRMGMAPIYSFSFVIATNEQPQEPVQLAFPRDNAASFNWLYQRVLGKTQLPLSDLTK